MLELFGCFVLVALTLALRDNARRGAALPLPGFALAVTTEGDEDMKIAGGLSAPGPAEELSEAEQSALAYMRQKEAGNVDRARELGRKFADALADETARARPDAEPLRVHHRVVLFSYIVNRVITELSPNSIIAQTALNIFYDRLEERSAELAEDVRDMAAFSLYILCERSGANAEDEIGRIYARLCGHEDETAFVDEGNALYRRCYDLCGEMHARTEYVEIYTP